ncbi:DUF2127 domain-containing protein [Cupriavidus basilensis]
MAKHVLGLGSIALFEAAKGALGHRGRTPDWWALLHRDAQALAESIIMRLHIDPASRYPTIFLSLLANPSDARLWAIGGSAAVYADAVLPKPGSLWHRAGVGQLAGSLVRRHLPAAGAL